MDVGGYTFALVCKCSARGWCVAGCALARIARVCCITPRDASMVSEPFVERARCGSQRGVKSVVWFCDRGLRDSNNCQRREVYRIRDGVVGI